MIIIINITKDQAHELNKLGVPFGYGGISHTHTSNKKYYLCEAKKNLKLLRKVEMSHKVKV